MHRRSGGGGGDACPAGGCRAAACADGASGAAAVARRHGSSRVYVPRTCIEPDQFHMQAGTAGPLVAICMHIHNECSPHLCTLGLRTSAVRPASVSLHVGDS